MSESLFGMMANPQAMGLLGLAQGFGQAAMPSRMPVPLGAAFGQAAGGMLAGMTQAQKLKLMAEQEKRLNQMTDLQRQEFDLKRKNQEQFNQLAAGVMAGGGDGAMPGMPGMPATPGQAPTTPAMQEPGGGQGGVTPLADRIVGAESGGNPNAKNPLSSASGAGQFIDSTWLAMMRKYKPEFSMNSDQEILALRNSPMLSLQMTQRYAEDNAAHLQSQGLPVNDGNIYMAHWFGPAGAASILKAPPGTPVAQVLPPQVLQANPTIANMTTDVLASVAARKVSGQTTPSPSPIAAASQTLAGGGGMDQYYKLMNMAKAFAASPDPRGQHFANIYLSMAKEMLNVGAWQDATDRDGRPGYRNRITGEFKAAPTDVERVRQPDMSERIVRRDQAAGMTSAPQPMSPVPTMGPAGPTLTDPANPQRQIGTPLLDLNQQMAAGVQRQNMPAAPPAATPGMPPANAMNPMPTPAPGAAAPPAMSPGAAIAQQAGMAAGATTAAQDTQKAWGVASKAAQDGARQNVLLDRALTAMSKFEPGMTANPRIWMGQVWAAMGGNPGNLSEGEILKSIQTSLQIGQARGEGAVSNFERQLLADRAPILMSTPQGARKVVQLLKSLNEFDAGIAEVYTRNAESNGGTVNPVSVHRELMDYMKKNPVPDVAGVLGDGGGAAPAASGGRGAAPALRWNVQKGAWE